MAGNRETALKNLAKIKKPGRPKGVPNKFTTLKDSFLNVYQELGGDKFLRKFAEENPKEYIRLLGTMLPKDIQTEVRQAITIAWANQAVEQIPDAEIIQAQLPDKTKDSTDSSANVMEAPAIPLKP